VLSRRSQAGITLIEVLIAVAIVGLLLAFAAPSATVWIQNTQLRNSAESILNGIQRARLEALKRNTNVSFQLTDANSTAWRVCLYDLATDDCQAAGTNIVSKPASEGSENARIGIENPLTDPTTVLNAGDGLPAAVTFDSFGRIYSKAPTSIARVDVRNPTLSATDERRLEILIAKGGQIRMCDPKLAQATNPQGCK
jgi:type IV fimbrial biogenesis protein FimT